VNIFVNILKILLIQSIALKAQRSNHAIACQGSRYFFVTEIVIITSPCTYVEDACHGKVLTV
jgi:hypothetical protein